MCVWGWRKYGTISSQNIRGRQALSISVAHQIWRRIKTLYDIISVKARTISEIRRKEGRDSVLSLSKLSSHGPHQPSRERQATFLPSPLQIHRLHPKEPIGRCIDFKTPACLCPSNIAATPFVDYVPFPPDQASHHHLRNYRRIFINILSSPVLPFCHPSDS